MLIVCLITILEGDPLQFGLFYLAFCTMLLIRVPEPEHGSFTA